MGHRERRRASAAALARGASAGGRARTAARAARYEILDTPREPVFDNLTWLATHICGTPIATMTLIDAARQWFKSQIGMPKTETPRDEAICAHAILHRDEILEVHDTWAD